MMELQPLAGQKHPRERNKSVFWCNCYLEMGPTRSLAKLVEYLKSGAGLGQTWGKDPSLKTLEYLSARYHWVDRATQYDQRQQERRQKKLEEREEKLTEANLAIIEGLAVIVAKNIKEGKLKVKSAEGASLIIDRIVKAAQLIFEKPTMNLNVSGKLGFDGDIDNLMKFFRSLASQEGGQSSGGDIGDLP
jgi:hypothetical protein